MARGTQDGVLNDPRWDGQDSQSLPDRPAHPDPSKFTEYGTAETVPSHGLAGHLDAKIGLTSDDDIRADRARYHRDVADQLEDEQTVAQERADNGDDAAKSSLKGFKDSIAHHRSLAKGARDDVFTDPGAAVRAHVLSGDAVQTVGAEQVSDAVASKEGRESLRPPVKDQKS